RRTVAEDSRNPLLGGSTASADACAITDAPHFSRVQLRNLRTCDPARPLSPTRATDATKNQRFAEASLSPLTDSNRRPPPYHQSSAATGRNPRQRFSLDSGGF